MAFCFAFPLGTRGSQGWAGCTGSLGAQSPCPLLLILAGHGVVTPHGMQGLCLFISPQEFGTPGLFFFWVEMRC